MQTISFGKLGRASEPLPGFTMMFILGGLTMLEWILAFSCWPIIVLLERKFGRFLFLFCNSGNSIVDNLFSAAKKNSHIRVLLKCTILLDSFMGHVVYDVIVFQGITHRGFMP